MPGSETRRRALFGAAALVLSAVSILCGLVHDGAFLAVWRAASFDADVDSDGANERIVVERRAARVEKQGRVLWTSGDAWLVEGALCGDIDGDGENELALLVWKRGSYGASRPQWVERDEPRFSQHIFLFDWEDGPKPFWMSSALRPQVSAWSLEEDGALRIVTAQGENTLWRWNTWGLERTDTPSLIF